MGVDRLRLHFPLISLDSSQLWGNSRRQEDVVARQGIRNILQTVCKEMRPHILEALVAQARFVVVKTGSRRHGMFVYYAGLIKVARFELPEHMAQRMDTSVLWRLAEQEDHTLARSMAAVVQALIPRPAPLRVYKREERAEVNRKADVVETRPVI